LPLKLQKSGLHNIMCCSVQLKPCYRIPNCIKWVHLVFCSKEGRSHPSRVAFNHATKDLKINAMHKLVLRRGICCCCHPSEPHRHFCLSAPILTQNQPILHCMGTPGPWPSGQRLRGVSWSPGKEGYNK